METTDNTTKSPSLMTMDEFLEYLETRGSRNATSPGTSMGIVGYPPALTATEEAAELVDGLRLRSRS
jgi:hypothetical protein